MRAAHTCLIEPHTFLLSFTRAKGNPERANLAHAQLILALNLNGLNLIMVILILIAVHYDMTFLTVFMRALV